MFASPSMQRALISIILLGIILPIMGLNMTTKRLSMIGDTMSHTALCGVAIGLAAGTMPIPWAIGISAVFGVFIEIIRNRFSKYSELTLSIVMSLAVGIVGILTTSSSAAGKGIEKYLFGSLNIVTWSDIWIILTVFAIVLIFNVAFYKQIMYSSFSETEASISGINVKVLNMINTILIASTVAVSSTIIGSLLVSSLLVIPVASSLQLFKSYRMTMIGSIIISLIAGIIGLVSSYYLDTNTGGCIVLISTGILLIAILYNVFKKFHLKIKLKNKA